MEDCGENARARGRVCVCGGKSCESPNSGCDVSAAVLNSQQLRSLVQKSPQDWIHQYSSTEGEAPGTPLPIEDLYAVNS